MVPTQDVITLALQSATFMSMDLLPAGVVAVVILAFAIALVSVAVRRRETD